ncbi:MAG: acetate--CoA ligase family protein [Chloroflexi bacterium]|nr:acetate--CoA ligase family protein [Chloroflexota bacterium]
MVLDSLSPFFNPQGVLIIGASNNPIKLGYGLARNLVQSGYQGAVHFVNPKGGSLLGKPIYTTVAEVPDPVDLAALLIPAPYVADALRDCGKRGIRAAMIGSGGFREVGAEGMVLEAEVSRAAQQYGIRLIGPNCIGLLDTHLPIDTTFLPPPGPTPGDVAFISHSGAICAAVIDWARGQGYGLSRLVSLGNQVDLCETDLLAPVAADPYTRVLALYLEGVKDGRHFVEQARQVVLEKPIIALKVGRFESGQRAVASHTGALAGLDSAYDAAFRRAGVLRAETSEGMFDCARALAWCPLPTGNRVAVLTNAGGPGVTAADALESLGLTLSEFEEGTRAALSDFLPPAASLNNPVDMLASASPEQFAASLQIVLDDPNVDSVMIIYPTPPMYTAGAVAKAIIPVVHNAAKPVVVAVMGERLIQEAVEHLRAARVPEYRFPERAAAALAALVERNQVLAFAGAESVVMDDVNPEVVRRVLENSGRTRSSDGFLSSVDASAILEAYGITTLKMKLAYDADQAGSYAQQIGFPVVLKIASPDIPHKSDIGGILLNLVDQATVRAGYSELMQRTRTAYPDAEIQGVHVQRMVPTGHEVIVGAVQDPQFAGLVMFGSGGTDVEGLKDVAFALAPLTQIEAEDMLESTWAGQKLKGFRNLPPADRGAVLDILIRLAQLADDFSSSCSADDLQIKEVEINPLCVLPDGQGAVAVDVRIRIG